MKVHSPPMPQTSVSTAVKPTGLRRQVAVAAVAVAAFGVIGGVSAIALWGGGGVLQDVRIVDMETVEPTREPTPDPTVEPTGEPGPTGLPSPTRSPDPLPMCTRGQSPGPRCTTVPPVTRSPGPGAQPGPTRTD